MARSIRWTQSCPSTNSWAIEASDSIPLDRLPTLVVTHEQTAGRGRSGRTWLADQGTLAFSILDSRERLPISPSRISLVALAAGLAIAEAIEAFAPPVKARIKWPNDVYVDGGKVAGVLVESAGNQGNRFVIGIGINVATRLDSFPVDIKTRARCLSEVAGRELPRFDLLPLVLERLEEHLSDLSASGQTLSLLPHLQSRCMLTGNTITLQQGPRSLEGHCLGIDASGGLSLLVNNQPTVIHSGEVVRLGKYT